MLRLARHMAAHRITALLAVACAVLGGAALITTTGVLAESGLRSQLPPGRLAGADIVVAADQEFHPGGDLPAALPERATVPARLVDQLAGLPGVTAAVGDIGFPVALVDPRGQVLSTDDPQTAGHGWSSTKLLADPRVEGRAPTGSGEVAVPATAGIRVGDRVQVVANGRPAASYPASAVVDAPGAGFFFADETAVRLWERAGEDGGSRAGTVDLIGLTTEPGAEERVASTVRDRVAGTGLKVVTGAERGETVSPGVGVGALAHRRRFDRLAGRPARGVDQPGRRRGPARLPPAQHRQQARRGHGPAPGRDRRAPSGRYDTASDPRDDAP